MEEFSNTVSRIWGISPGVCREDRTSVTWTVFFYFQSAGVSED